MIVRVTTGLFLAMVLSAGQVLAEMQDEWKPPPPMPSKFDWIQLTSEEWLKGEILAMYDEELEFDSDELDELTLDWDDIKQIRSAQIVQVGFLGGTHLEGLFAVGGGEGLVVLLLELLFEDVDVEGVVVDDEDTGRFYQIRHR